MPDYKVIRTDPKSGYGNRIWVKTEEMRKFPHLEKELKELSMWKGIDKSEGAEISWEFGHGPSTAAAIAALERDGWADAETEHTQSNPNWKCWICGGKEPYTQKKVKVVIYITALYDWDLAIVDTLVRMVVENPGCKTIQFDDFPVDGGLADVLVVYVGEPKDNAEIWDSLIVFRREEGSGD